MWLIIKRTIMISFFMSAFMSMTACTTTPTYNHLDAGARPHIQTVDSVLIAKQDRIGADIKKGSQLTQIAAVAQGSIIPILLDVGITSFRTMSANKMAKPMRETLEDFDYASEFRYQFKESMANSELKGVDKIRILREEYPGFRGQYIESSDADAVLFVDMKYAFTPKFDKLYLTSLAMMFPNKPELVPFQESRGSKNLVEFTDNIYRNQFTALVSSKVKDGTKEENAAYWAELSEEELKTILNAVALRMADAMAEDMSTDDVTGDPTIDKDTPNDNIELEKEDITSVKADTEVTLEYTNLPEADVDS